MKFTIKLRNPIQINDVDPETLDKVQRAKIVSADLVKQAKVKGKALVDKAKYETKGDRTLKARLAAKLRSAADSLS